MTLRRPLNLEARMSDADNLDVSATLADIQAIVLEFKMSPTISNAMIAALDTKVETLRVKLMSGGAICPIKEKGLMDEIIEKLRNNPVTMSAFVSSAIGMAVAFGWSMTDIQIASILAFINGAMAFIARSQVTPDNKLLPEEKARVEAVNKSKQ